MKAIEIAAYGGPEEARLVARATPEPLAGDVLVEVHAASVNPIDWKLRQGLLRSVFDISFPYVAGRDASGIVVAVGEGVQTPRVGDAVWCVADIKRDGTWAEYVAVRASLTAPKPASQGHVEAAALALSGATAVITVETAAIAKGQSVLIHAGAGGVGSVAIQLSKHRGAHVSVTCSGENADYARSLGADRVIDYRSQDFREAISDVDVVLDLVGGETHARSYDVLRKGGVLTYIVAAPIEDRSARYGVELRAATVRGTAAALATLAALVDTGAVKPPAITRLPLAQACEAMRQSQTGHARGKTVLEVR